jgi:4-amino-4-deoxychorismate lyase
MKKIIINGIEENRIQVQDRGFQYGDGLFETVAYKSNKLQLWDEHMQRLHDGCERLSIACVNESLWQEDIDKLQLNNDAVIKLSVTRGVSSRGYAYAEDVNVTRVTAHYAMPDYPEANQQGVKALICTTPVSINSALAGIKHLNRLDNVLARNEWQDKEIAEGFMLDDQGHVVEGTMSNVFCVLGKELYTPLLDQCGVAGVMRQQIIKMAEALNITVNVVDISRQNFLQMDAIFITNCLIGLWPVNSIQDATEEVVFQKNNLISRLQKELDL